MIHKFTWTQKDAGDCGAHGCHGHTDYKVTCSCGWKKEFKDEYSGQPDEAVLMINHRLEYLEKRLIARDANATVPKTKL